MKTTTGWVGKDDAMLVWDRNGNGQIDSGRELFGDQTQLAAGGLAAHGFAALSEQDSNADGKVDALDTNFSQFKVWQDFNQDGVSQADELFTLEQKGIASVNVQAAEIGFGGTAFDGGRITHTGSFTRLDGTAGVAGNLLFSQDNFHTEFVNHIAVSTQAKTITNWRGSGFVRNLQEAATLDAGIVDKVAAVKSATTRAGYVQAVGELLTSWAETAQADGLYNSMSQQARTVGNDGQMYELIARSPQDEQETSWLDVAIKGTEAVRTAFRDTLSSPDKAKFDTMRAEMLEPIAHLQAYEAFTGNPVLTWDAVRTNAFSTPTTTNAWGGATRIVMMQLSAAIESGQVRIAGVTAGVTGYVTVSVASAMQQIGSTDLDSFWRNILSNAADNMLGEYRLAHYLEKIDLVISADGVKLDFTKLDAALAQQSAVSVYEGAALVLDLKRVYGDILNGAAWNLDSQVGNLAVLANTNADVKRAFTDVGFMWVGVGQTSTAGDDMVVGNTQSDYLNGGAGDDFIVGDAGADSLSGEAGNDVLIGGKGADSLSGGTGNDTYVWALGDGNDTIGEFSGAAYGEADVVKDTLKLADVNADGVLLGRDQSHLYIIIKATGEKITVQNHFSSNSWYNYSLEQIEFADGTKLDAAAIEAAAAYRGTDNTDYLYGTGANEIFIGGKGADSLSGGTGNDTYVWALGDGNDTISEYDATAGNLDVLQFGAGINQNNLWLQHVGYDLEISIMGTTEQVTVKNWYADTASSAVNSAFQIERIKTADGFTMYNTDVEKLVQAMAAFAPPAAATTSWTSGTTQNGQTLLAVTH